MLGNDGVGNLGGHVLTLMLAIGPAVPILVPLKSEALVGFERGELVGAGCAVVVNSGAVVGGYEVAGGGLACLVELLIYEPAAGEAGEEVEHGLGLLENIVEGVIVALDETNVLPGSLFIDTAYIEAELVPCFGIGVAEVSCDNEELCDIFFSDLNEAAFVCFAAPDVSIQVGAVLIHESGLVVLVLIVILDRTAVEDAICIDAYIVSFLSPYIAVGIGCVGIDVLSNLIVIHVSKRVLDSGLAGGVAAGAIVLHAGAYALLHGVYVGIGIDRGAILPLCSGVEVELVDPAFTLSALGKPVSGFFPGVGYVGDSGNHLVYPCIVSVLVHGYVYGDTFDVAHELALIAVLPGMGVPGGGGACHGQPVGVVLCLGLGSIFTAGSFGGIAGRLFGLGAALIASCECGENHEKSQDDGQDLGNLFHYVTSLDFFGYSTQ